MINIHRAFNIIMKAKAQFTKQPSVLSSGQTPLKNCSHAKRTLADWDYIAGEIEN